MDSGGCESALETIDAGPNGFGTSFVLFITDRRARPHLTSQPPACDIKLLDADKDTCYLGRGVSVVVSVEYLFTENFSGYELS